MKSSIFTVRALTYSAVLIAAGSLLSLVKVYQMPQGGTVSAFSMLCVALIGYFFGARVGIVAAVTYGFLQLVLGDFYFVHPIQLILDYPLAFGALGVSGFFRDKKYGLITGYLIGVSGRLLYSFLSGAVYFGEYAPEGQNVFIYSFVYNLSYMGPEAVITVIILAVPAVRLALDKLKQDVKAAA